MFVKDNLQNFKAYSGETFPNSKFLLMFVGVVLTPIVLFAVGGRTQNTLWQFGLAGSFLVFATILLFSVSGGLMVFRSNTDVRKAPAVRPVYN